jgi:hypothetical protein
MTSLYIGYLDETESNRPLFLSRVEESPGAEPEPIYDDDEIVKTRSMYHWLI